MGLVVFGTNTEDGGRFQLESHIVCMLSISAKPTLPAFTLTPDPLRCSQTPEHVQICQDRDGRGDGHANDTQGHNQLKPTLPPALLPMYGPIISTCKTMYYFTGPMLAIIHRHPLPSHWTQHPPSYPKTIQTLISYTHCSSQWVGCMEQKSTNA